MCPFGEFGRGHGDVGLQFQFGLNEPITPENSGIFTMTDNDVTSTQSLEGSSRSTHSAWVYH